MRPFALPLAGLALLACQPLPPPQEATLTPQIPPGQFAPDQTDQAIIGAQETFALGRGLQGDPARTARATAYMEFLANDFVTTRWLTASPVVAPQLQIAKRDLRGFLNIAQDAPSQPVIDAMLSAADALKAGDKTGAERALAGGPFRDPPAVTLARLDAMPRIASVAGGANLAWNARFRPREDGSCRFPC